MADALVVETVDLRKSYGPTEAVRGLNLQVPAGSIYGFLGKNGAGKTTTIKLLLNLLRPTAGDAQILGRDVRHLGVAELGRIGYVSENQKLPEWMTTDQLLDYCRGLYPTWDSALAGSLRSLLQLNDRGPLRTVSRGTKMKAALLASLAYRPALLVLDEPFTGLDPLVRDQLIRALHDPPGGRPWTILLSSHDIQEVERVADRVGYIDRGRLRFAEPIDTLLERYRNRTPSMSLRDIFVEIASGAADAEGGPR